ncbi:MAG: hypothetical protein RL632_219 [Bacteroidota bacterium]|jgi:hypothetical protein
MKVVQTREDETRAIEILEDAFVESLGVYWMVKNPDSLKQRKWIIRLLFFESQEKQGAYITSDRNGALLFFQVSQKAVSLRLFFLKLYVLLFVTGIRNGVKAIRYQKKVAALRTENGWLGLLVATDKNQRTAKTAFEIKHKMFQTSDQSNLCIFIETTVPRVRKLYQTSGYVEYAEMKHPYTDLTVWFFKREPNSNSNAV